MFVQITVSDSVAQILSWKDEVIKGEALLNSLSRDEATLKRILGRIYVEVTTAIRSRNATGNLSTITAIGTTKTEPADEQPPTKRQKVA